MSLFEFMKIILSLLLTNMVDVLRMCSTSCLRQVSAPGSRRGAKDRQKGPQGSNTEPQVSRKGSTESQGEPKGNQKGAKGSQREPKGAKREPAGSQKELKGEQKRTPIIRRTENTEKMRNKSSECF